MGEGANQARAYVQASRTAETLTFVTNDARLLGMRLNDRTSQNAIACHELAKIAEDMAANPSVGLQTDAAREKSEPLIEKRPKDQLDQTGAANPTKPFDKEMEKEKSFDLTHPGMAL